MSNCDGVLPRALETRVGTIFSNIASEWLTLSSFFDWLNLCKPFANCVKSFIIE